MSMFVRGAHFASVSMIFRVRFRSILTVLCYFVVVFFVIHCSLVLDTHDYT